MNVIVRDYISRLAGYPLWVVLIELFFIGLVVFWVVDFLEGTRGERLFRSVLFILIVGAIILNLVAEKFRFERLQYLYKGFLIFVLIVAVAAFQPEIRRALIRIGKPRFLTHSSRMLAKSVEQIIAAVRSLAGDRIGAIIVIEKKVALGEFIETGIRLEARVTAELLKTIFKPGSPLHDMAVIVRGDRIIAARVQLPLAEAAAAAMGLGSRHRAAIGITSGSDAFVIVVSEETGIISIAENGKLTKNVAESQLRENLLASMEEMVPALGKSWKGTVKIGTKKNTSAEKT